MDSAAWEKCLDFIMGTAFRLCSEGIADKKRQPRSLSPLQGAVVPLKHAGARLEQPAALDGRDL